MTPSKTYPIEETLWYATLNYYMEDFPKFEESIIAYIEGIKD
jgi:hypothetical protein